MPYYTRYKTPSCRGSGDLIYSWQYLTPGEKCSPEEGPDAGSGLWFTGPDRQGLGDGFAQNFSIGDKGYGDGREQFDEEDYTTYFQYWHYPLLKR